MIINILQGLQVYKFTHKVTTKKKNTPEGVFSAFY